MQFLIKWPTRSRPVKFTACLNEWIAKLSGVHEFLFLVSQDTDDPCRFEIYRRFLTSAGATCLNSYYQPNAQPLARVKFIEGACKSKIEAVNFGVAGRNFDILINAADDMWPEVEGYDEVIAGEMRRHFPNLDGALNFWDGSPRQEYLCTLSVMGKRLYDYFGYIYHPSYVSLYADDEYTKVCHALGRMVVPEGYAKDQKCLIHHKHPIYGKGGTSNYDALMRRNEAQALYDRDKFTFEARRLCNFYRKPFLLEDRS